jgi:hypothetical protein
MYCVAVSYSMEQLGEMEQRHEMGCLIGYVGFKQIGYYGDAKLDGEWHMVYVLPSEDERQRFLKEVGGFALTAELQKKIQARRSLERGLSDEAA